MESPTLQELTEHWQRMEMKGTVLQKFIRDQQTYYRKLRIADREKQKEAIEIKFKREELVLEKIMLAEAGGIAEAESKYQETVLKLGH